MKYKLLIPFLGERIESDYYKLGIYPYSSLSEEKKYAQIRLLGHVILIFTLYYLIWKK